MKIKIVSDGTVHNTKVIDLETGKEVQGITQIKWYCDATTGETVAELQFWNVPVEIQQELYFEESREVREHLSREFLKSKRKTQLEGRREKNREWLKNED